jgi:hypothetical protein
MTNGWISANICSIRYPEKETTNTLETDRYLSKYLAWEWPAIKTGIELMINQ